MSQRKILFPNQLLLLPIVVAISIILVVACSFTTTARAAPLSPDIASKLIANESTTLLEDPGTILVVDGSACGESNKSGEEDVITLEGSLELPDYADNATVFLNGWHSQYLDSDHHLRNVEASIDDVNLDLEQGLLSWVARGELSDQNFDDGYEFCYYYTAIAWNQTNLNAVVDQESNYTTTYVEPANTTTALGTMASYLQSPNFAPNQTTAVLPRGFGLLWQNQSSFFCFDCPVDHHLLQIAYNQEHSEAFIEFGKEYNSLSETPPFSEPPLPTPASYVDSGFLSWETQGILKDNDTRRDFTMHEWVSALSGSDVGIIQPPFSILPKEDAGFLSGCSVIGSGGVKTEEHTIENVPFEYAIPMLTGWEMGYICDDEHVGEMGVWLHDWQYEKSPGSAVGTLRYQVSSVLRSNENSPHYFRHKVSILGLKATPGEIPVRQLPDLVIVKPHPDIVGGAGFCKRDEQGNLVVTIKNQGNADATESTATVQFALTGSSSSIERTIPALKVNESVDLLFAIPPDCFNNQCDFKITVDSSNQVDEFKEGNNSADGLCIG